MYAIVRTGGKQYKVKAGDVIRVEKLDQDLGSELDLTEVLLIGGDNPSVGQPTVKNAKVTVVITRQEKDRKVIIFKKKRRQGYRRFKTHRQLFTEIFVKSITGPDGNMVKADGEAKVVNRVVERAARQSERAAERAADAETHEASASSAKPRASAKKKVSAKKAAPKKAKKTGAKKVSAKKAKKK